MEPVWVTPPPDPAVTAPISFWRGLQSNLLSGMRLALGRRVDPPGFVSTFDQFTALLLITFGVGLALDWLKADAGAELAPYSLYAWGWCLGLAVLLSAIIARTLSAATDTRRVLVVTAAIAPYGLLLLWGISWLENTDASEDLISVLRIAVFIGIWLQIVRGAHGRPPILTAVIVMLASVALGKQGEFLYLDSVWEVPVSAVADHDEESPDQDWYSAESLYFNEPERISEAVDTLEPERPGVADVYYVGFAGDGSQRVFRREALLGQDVFAKRLGSGSRSIELINDEDDRITYPIGAMSGLHYALHRLGGRMNKDEDVLVLLLTSHGSKADGLSVINGSLPLNDIKPDHLRRALDAAGIQWRVIIVSACYAGTFIKPLQTDHTLIITAADAEHTSFGCADDRDLTYFGEAFLRDALPTSGSLVDAFEIARKAIRAREREEKLTPSNPQMYLGDAMHAKLATFDGNTQTSGTP